MITRHKGGREPHAHFASFRKAARFYPLDIDGEGPFLLLGGEEEEAEAAFADLFCRLRLECRSFSTSSNSVHGSVLFTINKRR